MTQTQAPAFEHPPQRIVSLVPSVTESLFDLGFGASVVGVTDWCIHPAEKTAALPKVGGTKNARPADVIALKPDMVIANQEENTPETLQALDEAGLTVWLTFPQTVDQALDVLYDLAGIFRSQQAVTTVRSLAIAVDYARSANAGRSLRYFCPIWADETGSTPWWMTFNEAAYPNDVLALLGGENVFAGRERRYPLDADLGLKPAEGGGERDTRYPRVTAEEIRAAAPELVLLPSEPFEFWEAHREQLAAFLLPETRFAFIDGSLITWHGTRLAKALRMDLKSF